MAVVFLEGGPSPTPSNGEHRTPSWTPSRGMSIRGLQMQGPKIAKRNSLLKLDFLVSCEIVRLNPSLSTTIKRNNNDNRQKLTITELDDSERPSSND